jgi:hypothetical protein
VPVLPLKLPSPPYCAVIVCVPRESDEVVHAACSPDKLTLEHSVVPPSLKVTLPVGVPVVTLLTVAVKVMDVPTIAGLAEETSAVCELSFSETIWSAESVPVLGLKLVSPPYSAVMVCVPAESAEVAHAACSADKATFEQIGVTPSLKVMLPVGLPAETALTVAVKVTACPTVDGFAEEISAVCVFDLSTS